MSHPRPHIAVVLAIACALFVMSAGVRLYRVSAGAIQVDEIHWKDRAHRIIGKIREGNWTQATHEPGHPGVPPALLMAAGQVIAQGVDERRGRSYGDPGYIDMYTSSRAATAAFASLIAPATFLALASVFGVTLAAIIGALLAFDPGHVGYSRLAHLDAVMTVFTVLSTILFYRAVEERRVGLKILSGICWGLALATKPTVLCLIPAFISYKVVRILTVDAAHDRGERRLVSISDIWAVVAGHIVLVVLYTRMWSHNGPYRTRLRVRSSLADGLYDFGMMLQAHPLLWGVATLLIIVLVAQTLVRLKLSEHFRPVAALLLLFLSTFLLAPQILENIVRFWTRVSGLSDVVHKSVGFNAPPPPGGYALTLFSRIPSLVVFLCTVAVVLWVLEFLRTIGKRRSQAVSHRFLFMTLGFAAVACWAIILSVSPKQAFRYILPATPLLTCIAVLAAEWMIRALPRFRRHASAALFFVAVTVQLYPIARDFPDGLFFFNSVSGGIGEAAKRGLAFPLAGTDQAVTMLREEAILRGGKMSVGVIGDVDAFEAAYRRSFPKEDLKVIFDTVWETHSKDVYVIYWSHLPFHREGPEILRTIERTLFAYRVNGQEIVSVVQLKPLEFATPVYIPLALAPRMTGKRRRIEELGLSRLGPTETERDGIEALPGRDQRGYVFFGDRIRLEAGEYEFTFLVGSAERSAPVGVSPETLAMRFGVGDTCAYELRSADLPREKLGAVTFRCAIPVRARPQLRGFWFGKEPVVVEGLLAMRIGNGPEVRKLSEQEKVPLEEL